MHCESSSPGRIRILPYPKYNEAQDNYYTVVFDNHSVFCVPKTVKDPERSGLIMEAMGYESMRIVTPAYYEIMLRGTAPLSFYLYEA